MVSAHADLSRLLRRDGSGLYSSGGELYGDAIFGRDSAEIGDYLLHLRPDVARGVLITLARLQGTVDTAVGPHSNEEERGKIHHEHRELLVDGRRITQRSEDLLRGLAARWGGDETSLTYYGSADATPLWVRLLARWCESYGPSLLDEAIIDKDGNAATVGDKLLAALDWIFRQLDESPVGMVEFLRRNPDGIAFQAWKDSGTSYLHLDGAIANWDAPIAAVEVQGYTYDALLAAGRVLAGREPARAEACRGRAGELRRRILERLWMPKAGYFAMGLDRDADGRPRWIESVASNAALLLDTGLFDGLPDADRYVAGLVRRICGWEFVTDAGLRCRSLAEEGVVDFQDYHGTWAVWMREAFAVLKGLDRQGLPELARRLGTRTLNAVNIAGANVEFLYVSPDGRVMYDFRGADLDAADQEEVAGTNTPEEAQGWTVAASLALKWWLGGGRSLQGGRAPVLASPRAALEAEVLADLPPCRLLGSEAELRAAYDKRGRFRLNPALGLARDLAARERRRTHA